MPWFVLPSSTTALNAVLQALSRTSSSSPTTLALFTSLFILFYIYSTSNLFSHNNHHSTSLFKPPSPFSTTPSISTTPHFDPIFHNNDYESTKSQSFQLGYGLRPQSQRGLPLPQQFSPKGYMSTTNLAKKRESPNLDSSKRKKLAFFAEELISQVRVKLVETWKNDSEIFVHHGRLNTPYADELLGNKFFLHVKGFELNTTHIGDSLYYGCIPVIIANYYGLPFADVLN
ncbi:hypothetical protein ACSQ67_000985 [Phaseolus vulgaris]